VDAFLLYTSEAENPHIFSGISGPILKDKHLNEIRKLSGEMLPPWRARRPSLGLCGDVRHRVAEFPTAQKRTVQTGPGVTSYHN
jgi:hypothetical protein